LLIFGPAGVPGIQAILTPVSSRVKDLNLSIIQLFHDTHPTPHPSPLFERFDFCRNINLILSQNCSGSFYRKYIEVREICVDLIVFNNVFVQPNKFTCITLTVTVHTQS
jgi:hypothetical protein